MKHEISKFYKMSYIAHLFGKDTRKIPIPIDMANSHKVALNIFPDMVFPHLNMTQSFGSAWFRPVDTSLVVIVYCIDWRHKKMFDTQKLKKLYQF